MEVPEPMLLEVVEKGGVVREGRRAGVYDDNGECKKGWWVLD